MNKNDNLSSLLLSDETVLWSGHADNSVQRSVATYFSAAVGFIFVGMVVVALWQSYFSTIELTRAKVIIPALLLSSIGVFFLYGARSKKLVLDAPSFRLSQRRAFVSISLKDGVETTARFIEPGRLVQVIKKGKFFDLHIPVRPESAKDHGFMTFNRLSQSDLDAALLVINSALGTPNPPQTPTAPLP